MNGLFLFVADWASEACTSANQILSASTSKHAVPFTVVNEDSDSMNLFDSMRIEVVPSVVAVKGGKEVGRVEGVDSKGIISLVDKYVNFKEDESEAKVENINIKPATNDVPSTTSNTATNINAYSNEQIVALVNRHKLMLLLKAHRTPSMRFHRSAPLSPFRQRPHRPKRPLLHFQHPRRRGPPCCPQGMGPVADLPPNLLERRAARRVGHFEGNVCHRPNGRHLRRTQAGKLKVK